MRKYLTVFLVAWQNEFTYRLNFILGHFRNLLRFLMTYFLWSGIFVGQTAVFGYGREQILTYVFMVLIVQTFVTSAPSQDNIGGEIANGDLSNYLLRPVSYVKYWFMRDMASKLLNLLFAFLEISVLWLVFRPALQFPADFFILVAFLASILLAVSIFYFLSLVARFIAFWAPENTWAVSFLVLVLIEILAGAIFPLDVLPKPAFFALQMTPFPYLVYFPIAIFVGKITGLYLIQILLQSAAWAFLLFWIMIRVWMAGLKVYGSEGR